MMKTKQEKTTKLQQLQQEQEEEGPWAHVFDDDFSMDPLLSSDVVPNPLEGSLSLHYPEMNSSLLGEVGGVGQPRVDSFFGDRIGSFGTLGSIPLCQVIDESRNSEQMFRTEEVKGEGEWER